MPQLGNVLDLSHKVTFLSGSLESLHNLAK